MNTVTQIQLSPEELSQMLREEIKAANGLQAVSKDKQLFEAVEYYTANQAAKICGFTVETLRRKVKDGLIRPENRKVREKYHRSEILRYLKEWEDANAPFK